MTGRRAGASSYLALLGRPRVARLLLGFVLSRLPYSMLPLGILLLVHEQTNGFAGGALVVACYAVTAALTSPLKGRQLDVRGTSGVLVAFAVANAVLLVALAFSARVGVWAAALVAVAVSAATPAVTAGMRAQWPELVDDQRELAAAYALDAILGDLLYIVGPSLVALLAVLAGPESVILLAGACSLVGTLLYVGAQEPEAAAPTESARPTRAALHGRAFLLFCLSVVPAAGAIGAIDVGLTAFAGDVGRAADAGFLLALLSVGSIVGGLAYGMLRWGGAAPARYAGFVGAFGLALLLLVVPRSLPTMAVVVLLPGLLLSPLTAAMYTATADVSPPGRRAEAYSWLATATSIGNAAGTAACGWVVDSAGVRQGLALPVVACLASAALAWVAARAATPAAEAELGSPVAARRSGG